MESLVIADQHAAVNTFPGSQPATEAASEGRPSEGGEVVTRQVYRKVRLDHLLSKEISGRDRLLSVFQGPGKTGTL